MSKKYGASLVLSAVACCLCLLGAVALAAILPASWMLPRSSRR